MKPIRISCLKHFALPVAVLAWFLTSACSSPEEMGEALIKAASQGDAAEVKALLDKGATVNIADDVGMTPLMAAAGNGHAEVVKNLLAQGAEVNHKSMAGKTALAFAKNKEVIQLLKAAGAK